MSSKFTDKFCIIGYTEQQLETYRNDNPSLSSSKVGANAVAHGRSSNQVGSQQLPGVGLKPSILQAFPEDEHWKFNNEHEALALISLCFPNYIILDRIRDEDLETYQVEFEPKFHSLYLRVKW